MGRRFNSKNKSKFIYVKLSELNRLFHPDTEIKVSSIYSLLYECEESEPPLLKIRRNEDKEYKNLDFDDKKDQNNREVKNKIPITIIDFAKDKKDEGRD